MRNSVGRSDCRLCAQTGWDGVVPRLLPWTDFPYSVRLCLRVLKCTNNYDFQAVNRSEGVSAESPSWGVVHWVFLKSP